MVDLSTDIVVIGGGPGGSAAAIEAARAGLDVVVIDKATFPRDKCCGDGLTTGALRHLDDLGLVPATVPSWRPIDDVSVRTPSGRERRFPLPIVAPSDGASGGDHGLYAAVARRSELDAALLDLARRSGAAVNEGHAITAIAQTDDGVAVTATGPAGPLRIDASFAVAADGMWSPTRKLLGIASDGYRGDWHAFRQYFESVTGRANRELLVWFEPDLLPGYAWSFPVGDGSANVGFGMPRVPGRSVQPMKDLWPRILARPHVVEALGPAARAERAHRAWPIPARLGRLPFAEGRVLFVGDALAAADPMTGEGIGQALETGRAASGAIAAHSAEDPAAVVIAYETELRRGMAKDHAMARALSLVLAHRPGVEAAVAMAGATRWTRNNFARWLFEDYPRAALVTPRRWHRRLFTSPGAYAETRI